jgi:hypothetical protein
VESVIFDLLSSWDTSKLVKPALNAQASIPMTIKMHSDLPQIRSSIEGNLDLPCTVSCRHYFLLSKRRQGKLIPAISQGIENYVSRHLPSKAIFDDS